MTRQQACRLGISKLVFWLPLLLAVTLCAMVVDPRSAGAREAYRYRVRVFGGNEGSVNGGSSYVIDDIPYGQELTLERDWVSLKEGSKYYVRGFRLSGEDALHAESFTVTSDMDFVVAYGVQGDLVSYTLRFVEEGTGRKLSDPRTYYGNRGDKPVVAYKHIPGYRPLFRNITGTLGDEGTNTWVFEYVANGSGGTSTSGSARGNGSGGGNVRESNGGVASTGESTGAQDGGATEVLADKGSAVSGDLLDVDEAEEDLAASQEGERAEEDSEGGEVSTLPFNPLVVLVLVVGIVLAVLLLVVRRRHE